MASLTIAFNACAQSGDTSVAVIVLLLLIPGTDAGRSGLTYAGQFREILRLPNAEQVLVPMTI